jgi:putative ABC transport system substrate-binding protein
MTAMAMRTLIIGFAIALALRAMPADAAEPVAAARICVLMPSLGFSPLEEGLRQGLRELGYTEGKNIVIEWRRSAEHYDNLRSLADDLVRSKIDLIVALGTPASRAALSATTTVPVVFFGGDPVGTGLAASLARPGANGTGISSLSTEVTAKRLEFLHQLAPQARRFVLLGNPSSSLHAEMLKVAQEAARVLGVHLITLDARNADELGAALQKVQRSSANGFAVSADILFLANKAKIAQAVAKARLPAIFPWKNYHDDGVLMSYGPSMNEIGRHAAVYVDKILRGAKPAELPVEQMSDYKLIVDLRVASGMGIHVPQDLLLRADEVMR